jgi:hypothetical protein
MIRVCDNILLFQRTNIAEICALNFGNRRFVELVRIGPLRVQSKAFAYTNRSQNQSRSHTTRVE